MAELSLTLDRLAAMAKAEAGEFPDVLITGVNTIEDAQPGEATFLANPKYARFVETTQASCVFVTRNFKSQNPINAALLRVDNPQAAFLVAVKFFAPERLVKRGFRHPSAVIHKTARVDASAYVGPHASVAAGCVVGAGVALHAGVALYENVSIGAETVLHAGVVCYHDTVVGERCVIHAGAVLGSDGFGFVERKDGSFEKIPQIGNVVVGNDAEIGANCAIDRAALGSTIIGEGAKLDNLIHVAHNVRVGEHTAIAAQSGVSGSTRLGKRNRVAGQVGFVGHLETADDVIVYAQSGVAKSLSDKGVYFGSPAKPLAEELRLQAALKQLPELVAEIRKLKQEIASLRQSQNAE